jgi:GT2 family glycosyltransferase/lipopolysaccharide/colanic/teichoic acid biosynthesis glycosyltransferase
MKPLKHAPKLSIVIVSYNVREFLQHALMSLKRALKGIHAEIFVVDNASEDGSAEMVRRRFPHVRLIVNKENVGFARANNQALRQARGTYLLLLNPDTLVQEDTVSVMLRFLEANPHVGLAGCKVLNPDGTFQPACRRSFPTPWVAFTRLAGLSRLFPQSHLFGRYNLTYLSPDDTYEIDAVSGAFMILRRSVYEQVGGLDEDFFMYGEDIDWCYRIQQAGWKIYYVHSTQIIHYKGESTRRSSIDEIRMFYDAMHLFVRKHLARSAPFFWFIKLAIHLSSRLAAARARARPFFSAAIDFILVDAALLLAERLWMGEFFSFPQYAYPLVLTVPGLILVASLAAVRTYRSEQLSVVRSVIGVVIAYVVIAAIVFFARSYAFSRAVLAIAAALTVVSLPGWRIAVRLLSQSHAGRRRHLFGRRALLVGSGKTIRELLARVRQRMIGDYEIVGLIETSPESVGAMVDGLRVVGSLENIGKVISDYNISDVIFSTDRIPYMNILETISRTKNHPVNFYLVPNTMEVIIGKGRVDSLSNVPLVEVEYNIGRLSNRVAKRLMDVALGVLLLISCYPFVYLKSLITGKRSSRFIQFLPRVVQGSMSFVGPPPESLAFHMKRQNNNLPFIGKPGITGLIQLRTDRQLTHAEIEQYNLYYAKNQSLMLDAEILLRAILRR